MYEGNTDFIEPWKTCRKPIVTDRSKWLDYFIQEDMLFRGNQLYIPRSSMRDNLIKKKHSGGLAGHFGIDKTVALVSENYF